ncbi:MAG: hypothetical protein ABI693_17095 [Bryobacteraceae bacterium]
MSAGAGGGLGGDLNAVYNVAFFKRNPNYELIVLGMFPEARFMGLTAYDDHWVSAAAINDRDIVPLTSNMQNPYTPSATYLDNQKYAAVVSFGGAQPTTISPGCGFNGINLRSNIMTVTDRHTVPTWTGYPGLPRNFPPHQTGLTDAGSVYVRAYLPSATTSTASVRPIIIVRDLSNGCAVTADDAQNALQLVNVTDIEVFNPWMSVDQINRHFYFQTSMVSRFCYGVDPLSSLRWFRGGEYTAGDNPVTSYSNGQLKASTVSQLIGDPQGLYMRVRFRAPTTPQYPCPGCLFDDSEDLRYWSLSFQTQGTTFASLSDDKLVKDAQGYVTLIVNLNPNSPQPAQVTTANGYTYLNLSAAPAIETLSSLALRQMLPSSTYQRCASNQIPYSTTEYNDQGGLMGEYVPAVDFRRANQLPAIADHVDQGDTCGLQSTTGAQPCSIAP